MVFLVSAGHVPLLRDILSAKCFQWMIHCYRFLNQKQILGSLNVKITDVLYEIPLYTITLLPGFFY